jgi:ribosome-associated translation inhibitor RaiA
MNPHMHSTTLPSRLLPKQVRGRTAIDGTPITTRSRVPLRSETRRNIEQRLRKALAPFATRIERASIRFEDVNGPRHGVGLLCAFEIVFSGSDSVIIEQRATNVLEAVRKAIPRVSRSVRRRADRSEQRTPRATHAAPLTPRPPSRPRPAAVADDGSLIGKRVGRGPKNWAAVLARPEKSRRDAEVDTAEPGVSASDRKVGGHSTARRNSKRNDSGMTYALEDSRTTPSRKSTRGGKNRVKAATQLARRARRKLSSPAARAASGR